MWTRFTRSATVSDPAVLGPGGSLVAQWIECALTNHRRDGSDPDSARPARPREEATRVRFRAIGSDRRYE